MIERDRRYMLGAAGPRIEIDDAYIGGERTGEGAGRGRRGHTPFIIAVETSSDGRPLHTRLQVVRGFQAGETKRLCARVVAGTTVVSDGGQWFRCIAEQRGIVHERHVTGSDRRAARHPAFRWANTMLANIKNSLLATHRVVAAKHLPRYLGAFAWRFNRRFVLKTIHERLAIETARFPAALSGKRPAGSEGFGVGCGHGSDLLSPASFSAGRHPARRVAVPSLHPKLPRCRGAWMRPRQTLCWREEDSNHRSPPQG
jgi:hypothetical protein